MTDTVIMPHEVRKRPPIQYFLVLVLVNLMWAFQFSGAKIATERLGPITVALIPLTLATVLFAPLLRMSRVTSRGHGGDPWGGLAGPFPRVDARHHPSTARPHLGCGALAGEQCGGAHLDHTSADRNDGGNAARRKDDGYPLALVHAC